MIINNRSDFDAAPAEQREQFMKRLALSVHKWRWTGSDWEQYENTDSINRFGFTVADFPDAPVPAKPDYNPDDKAIQSERDSASLSRAEFKLALLERGELDSVKAAMEAPDADPRAVILWEDANTFDRTNDDLLRLASDLGYTEADLDDIFGIGA